MSDFEYRVEPERYELSEPQRYRFALDRRDFLCIAGAMGAGFVVVVTVPRAAAQESGRTGRGRTESDIAAWLRIDGEGHVTAYTGKVEIGQNIRTSLAQAVADELRLPIGAITLVMADTDRTPYDAGTFGSQTTPRMSRQLSRAAATAREMLVQRAARQWQLDPQGLAVADGRVTAAGGRSATYGELTHGAALTGVVADDAAVVPADKWSVRGAPAKKVDGRSFVTGRHEYAGDVHRPGMLHGRIVRPASIGASLVSIDDGPARAMRGVTMVRDGEFIGLVAPDERKAVSALRALRAEWRPRGGQPSSQDIYEHLKKSSGDAGGSERGSAPYAAGDVARARTAGSRHFDATYHIPYIAHVPLEPRTAVAEWTDDRLTVWTGTQRPFGVRSDLASAFRIPEDRVRVIVPDMGSGYGGKHTGEVAIEAAKLAKAVRQPVKLVWTRAEEFTWAYFRPAGVIDIRASADDTGRVIAWEFDNWNSGAAGIRTPYDVPNQRIAFHPSDSPLRQGSYRGLAATANHYAREMHMDEIARALEVDPVEFRLRHLKDDRLRAVLAAAAKKASWPPAAGGARAWGIACGTEKGSYVATAAELSKTADGFKVARLIVAFECGAIVNPDGLENQVEGAVVQGLGGALFEMIDFRDGVILNGTMAQYRVPRFKDVPPIEVVLLNRTDLPSAGAGETPIVCVAPAIGSAARAFGRVGPALPVSLSPAASNAAAR
jgi:CO/xanthine dehydrogenase Mo-binding subunit